MPKERLNYPKAAQIAGNPKEAEQYIAGLVRENWRLRAALARVGLESRKALEN